MTQKNCLYKTTVRAQSVLQTKYWPIIFLSDGKASMYKHTLIVYCEGAGHIPIYILEKAYEIMNCTDSTTFLSEIGNFVQCADER
jgi:hypothetical protein